ncbi:TetR/AcrR family transcriptional regulator [Gordonia sp. PKS22-38]|uniref:TetR/AcrR family transcriptional regulator n=2 Tax=Gordonia prachuapensis TaxID=3115651 RepID=A0ABU7MX58_9ACTN|nr:TetR/AcrR family transcriptional regulator [Gordonia sp. PKS22-38]
MSTAATDEPDAVATASGDWRHVEPLYLPVTLAAAKDAFHERGFHGTSIRDIASRAGVSLPTLYYHHENKQGILVALLEAGISSILNRVRAAIADGDTPRQQLSNAIETIVLHMTADLQLASVGRELRYLDSDNPHRQHYVGMRTEMEDLLADVLRRGMASGDFQIPGNVREVLRYLLGACQEVTTWYRPEGARSPAQVAESYAATSLRAVGASSDTTTDHT